LASGGVHKPIEGLITNMFPIQSRFLMLAVYVLFLGGVVRDQKERLTAFDATSLFIADARAASTLPDQSGKTRRFRETTISPDGKRVAWVEAPREKDDAPSTRLAIFVANLGDSEPKPLRISTGDGDCVEHSPVWSPDGERLAFLSDRAKKGQLQLYVAPADGGKAKLLTSLKGFLASPRWSPDGKRLSMLFTENALRNAGPTQPATIETGEVGDTVHYQRLTLCDPETGKVSQVSPADLYVYEYDWSPDGQHCVLCAAHGSGDNNWYLAKLYVLTPASQEIKVLLEPGMQIAVLRWSPDGKMIAFIGGLMSDEGVTGGDIYVVAASGDGASRGPRAPRNLTPDLDSSASWLAWQPSSKEIIFGEHVDGGCGIAQVDLDGRVKRLWKSDETITGESGSVAASTSRDGQTFALIRQSYQEPPEVWAGPLGKWKALTQANKGIPPLWGKVENLHWKSDSFQIQGWLLYPKGYEPGRRYPLVVHVHGGPASVVTPSWLGEESVTGAMSRAGYFVLFPNPRGSYGQGERFTRANVKDSATAICGISWPASMKFSAWPRPTKIASASADGVTAVT
jgi:dipeptidyl aminopeptidase/acylaminoacyl peptidase